MSLRNLIVVGVVASLLPLTHSGAAEGVPKDCDQLIVGLANSWNSNRASVWCFARTSEGWKATRTEGIASLLGKNGLAWGRGLMPKNPEALGMRMKREGDRRTPAGLFKSESYLVMLARYLETQATLITK